MKDKKLTIRITNFEKRQLAQEAERRGMTQSELIRSLIARFRDPCIPCAKFIPHLCYACSLWGFFCRTAKT
ncbi:MAG: CopG family transcriptional regulator [Moorea sp. SIOASIH]|uniref:ribbon-helix-helix domain-containing protein n=1 Tax=Moorena sp. SIOASIH TaxID=2607817 RepID=UPI0013BA8C53|nr:CopG family transcriptional regulator [Moorena sp. SIOASIH]NEO34893.1 CopG family transcriptional regulator [Moorena sp. SIOASIH]